MHFLLGPATVALAAPLFRHLPKVRRSFIPMLVAVIGGSLTAIVSAVMLARAFGLDRASIMALRSRPACPPDVVLPMSSGSYHYRD